MLPPCALFLLQLVPWPLSFRAPQKTLLLSPRVPAGAAPEAAL